jgi:DNA polymerase IV
LAQRVQLLLRREISGRAFRLIGVGVSDLRPATLADPPNLFREINR